MKFLAFIDPVASGRLSLQPPRGLPMKLLPSLAALCLAAPALAQSHTLSSNLTAPTTGADIATFNRTTHFTFDARVTTTGDWQATEINLDIVGNAQIWHASDQIATGGNNLLPPN